MEENKGNFVKDLTHSLIYISALAGMFLKSQNVYFFLSTILGTILNNSDILFGSDYKREN